MDVKEEALKKHYEWKGKIEVVSRIPIKTKEDLALAYTPGVAEPCLKIHDNSELSFELTRRSSGYNRRNGSAGLGRHRRACGYACYGREVLSV